jgi:hypothetical protein
MWWLIAATCYLLFFADVVSVAYTAWFHLWVLFVLSVIALIAILFVVHWIRCSSVLD